MHQIQHLVQHYIKKWNVFSTCIFFKNLSSAQQNYSVYERELLAIYEAIKDLKHMVGVRSCTVYTDHKSLCFLFAQKSDKCALRQLRHPDFIAQFSIDIQHVIGEDDSIADAFSHINTISLGLNLQTMTETQLSDGELCKLLQNPVSSNLLVL